MLKCKETLKRYERVFDINNWSHREPVVLEENACAEAEIEGLLDAIKESILYEIVRDDLGQKHDKNFSSEVYSINFRKIKKCGIKEIDIMVNILWK